MALIKFTLIFVSLYTVTTWSVRYIVFSIDRLVNNFTNFVPINMDSKGQIITAVSIVGGVIFVTLLFCLLYFCIRHRQKEAKRQNFAKVGGWGDDAKKLNNDKTPAVNNNNKIDKIKDKDRTRMKSGKEQSKKKKDTIKKKASEEKESKKGKKTETTALSVKTDKKKGKQKKVAEYLSYPMAGAGKPKKTTIAPTRLSQQQLSLPEKYATLPAKGQTLPNKLLSLPPKIEQSTEGVPMTRPVKGTATSPLSLPAPIKSIQEKSPLPDENQPVSVKKDQKTKTTPNTSPAEKSVHGNLCYT